MPPPPTTSRPISAGGSRGAPAKKQAATLPANFYSGYKPPQTPQLKPRVSQPDRVPAFSLPDPRKVSGIEALGAKAGADGGGGFSLKHDKHPMSMPVHAGRSNPLLGRADAPEEKTSPAASSGRVASSTVVGSLTTLALIGGQPIQEDRATDDMPMDIPIAEVAAAAAAAEQSTGAQDQGGDDDDGDQFDMEEDDEDE